MTPMTRQGRHRFVLTVLAALLLAAVPAVAQYDRDGRYVPSPNGIPQDPYARPVPMYPGTPGGAIGTPADPRNSILTPPKVNIIPRPTDNTPYSYSRSVDLTIDDCDEGWSKDLRVTKVEFNRRCALLRKKREKAKE